MDEHYAKIEIEHLAGELYLEINIQLAPTNVACRITASNITWQANGVRLTIPTVALDSIREALAHLGERVVTESSPTSEKETGSRSDP